MSFLANFIRKYLLIDNDLREIERLIVKGDHNAASHMITTQLHQQEKDSTKYKKLLVLQIRIANLENNYRMVLLEGEKLFDKVSTDKKSFSEAFTLLLLLTDALNVKGDFIEYQRYVTRGEKILSHIDRKEKRTDYIRGLYIIKTLKARLHTSLGRYNQAIDIYKEALQLMETLDEKEDMINLIYDLAWTYSENGSNQEALKYAQMGLKLSKDIKNEICLSKMYSIFGLIYDDEKALTYLMKGLNLAKKQNDLYRISVILNNIGYHYLGYQGDYSTALAYYMKAKAIVEKQNYKKNLAIVLGNIAEVYQFQGLLDEALEVINSSLVILKEMFDEEETLSFAEIFLHLGSIYREKGNRIMAKQYLSRALTIGKKFNNYMIIAKTSFMLFELSIEEENKEQAKYHLVTLKNVQKAFPNNFAINAGVEIGEALLLRISDRFSERMKALELLKDYSQKYMFWIYPKIIFVNIIELLFQEYKSSSSKSLEVLDEMEETLNDLSEYAQTQHSFLLHSQSLLLTSKLLLLKKEYNKAQEILAEAQKIAETRGLTRLARLISNEFDQVLFKIKKEDKDTQKEFEDIIKYISGSKQLENPDIVKDEPILFLIITQAGLTILSHSFTETKTVDDQLLGGFLQAIIAFGNEVFSAKTSIDRIMYKDYIIALKTMDDTYLLCYIFRGNSYPALQKLSTFLDELNKCQECKVILDESIINNQEVSTEGKERLKVIIVPTFRK